jgi:thiamine pyrophosphokinase
VTTGHGHGGGSPGDSVGDSVGGALILADGAAPTRAPLDAAWPGWDAGIGLVLAADGGARHAAALGVRLDRWVGDGDSIDPAELARLAAAGVVMEHAATDKDESDTELALLAAIRAGAEGVVILGGLGGVRVDHALANVGLLRHPDLGARPVWLYDEMASRISLIGAPDPAPSGGVARELVGREGDLVSLLPLGPAAEGVRTEGLRYALHGETLHAGRTRGLSNVRSAAVARITVESGWLLVIETPATVRP